MATQTPNHAGTRGKPAFPQQLYSIVEDPNCDHLIHWSPDGESFVVRESNQLAREVFGKWFKHESYPSFLRQLSNYGFHKVPNLQRGALNSSGTNDYENFEHSYFRRDQPDLLGCVIPRKDKNGPRQREITPTDDNSQLQAILLEVDTLKSHLSKLEADNQALREEFEADNQALREELGNVQGTLRQHQKLLLCVLVNFGLGPMAGQHQWTRGNDRRLMIQGVEEKEGTAVPAPPCGSQPNFSGICVEVPPSPSGPAEVLDQWTSSLVFPTEDSKTTFLNSSGNLALLGDVVGSFPPDLPHIISPTFDFDNSVDFSSENISGYNPNYGMGENDPRSFANMASSFIGSSSGPVTASGMQTTSGMSRAPLATGDPTHLTAGIIREKRKASAMDESCGTEPQCTSRVPSPSLFPYDNHPRVESVCPPSLFRFNDDHTTIDITTTLSPSPKRAKIIPAHLNGE